MAVIGVVSCKEKPEVVEEGSVVESIVEKVKGAVVPDAEVTRLSAEERAAKVGFAQYLPKDAELVLSVYDAKGAAEQLKGLKLYGLLEMGAGMGLDMEEEFLDEDLLEEGDAEQGEDEFDVEMEAMGGGPDPWVLFGQEVTLALGKPAGEQLGHLQKLNKRMAYFQALALGRAAQEFAKTGDPDDFMEALTAGIGNENFVIDLINDPEGGVALFDKLVMPPLYVAMRAKEGEVDQAAQIVGGMMAFFGMAGEMVVPVEFKAGGSTFSGYKLLGQKLADLLAVQREEMEEDLKPEAVTAIVDAISRKNLVVVTGVVGDYVVSMVGGDEADLKLTADVKESLAGSEQLNFVDAYADKPLVSLMYGGKSGWDGFMNEGGGLGAYAIGIRDGISGGGALGDTRDIAALLQLIADRENDLLSMVSTSDFGMVAYTDEGLRIEAFGGYDRGSMDWSAETSLAHLCESGDPLLFFNAAGNEEYHEKASAYFEAIFETVYASTIKLSELEVEVDSLGEIKQFAQLFDTQFRTDVVGLYEAMSGSLGDGLGNETAILIDLKGAVPAVPGIPQAMVDAGKAPRMTWISPVKDRSKLAESWKKMDASIASLLGKAGEMTGQKIPMQKPISSEKDGMTTWFFSFPFFQDDFLPSVTVSDKWFAASTSKLQAVDLVGKAEAGGAAGQGLEFFVNFSTLADYADMMLAAVDENKEEIFTNEFARESFVEEKVEFVKMIEAFREFDSLSWTAKKKDGIIHNSMHFKTR